MVQQMGRQIREKNGSCHQARAADIHSGGCNLLRRPAPVYDRVRRARSGRLDSFFESNAAFVVFCGIELNRCAYASPGTLAVDSLYEVVLFMKTDREGVSRPGSVTRSK